MSLPVSELCCTKPLLYNTIDIKYYNTNFSVEIILLAVLYFERP